MPFALEPFWNDLYAAGGFWVGIIGLVIGVVGFGYTIYQVRKTTSAAVAAERAAEETLATVKTSFRRFIGGLAHRLLAEVRSAVESDNWSLAALRCNDLADLIGQLPEQSRRAADIADSFRTFAQAFADKAKSAKKRYSATRWRSLLREALALLDRMQSPFPHPTEVTNGPDRQTPTARPESADEDEGAGGELDAAPGDKPG